MTIKGGEKPKKEKPINYRQSAGPFENMRVKNYIWVQDGDIAYRLYEQVERISKSGLLADVCRRQRELDNTERVKSGKRIFVNKNLEGLDVTALDIKTELDLDILCQNFMSDTAEINPKKWKMVADYNRQLREIYEKTWTAYRGMSVEELKSILKYGLQPNPKNFEDPSMGVSYCSVSRTAAAKFKNYPVMVQFKDVNRAGKTVEYIPLYGLTVNGVKVTEVSKYGAVQNMDEHEVRFPANSGAKIEAVYIKQESKIREMMTQVREMGWDGEIIVITRN